MRVYPLLPSTASPSRIHYFWMVYRPGRTFSNQVETNLCGGGGQGCHGQFLAQWRPHHRCASATASMFYSTNSRHDWSLAILISCGSPAGNLHTLIGIELMYASTKKKVDTNPRRPHMSRRSWCSEWTTWLFGSCPLLHSCHLPRSF